MKYKSQLVSASILAFTFIALFTASTKAICTVCPSLLPPPEVWILASRPDGQPGSGSLLDPYDGSTAAKFDAIMQSIPAYTVVHLGPGNFLTNGAAWDAPGFVMKKGQQVVGAGRDVTTVKLMHASQFTGHPWYEGDVFVHPYNVDGSDSVVADLTIDLNSDYFASQLGVSSYKLGAVWLRGSNCTIRNVHVIHGHGDSASLLEAFTLAVWTWYDGSAWQSVTGAVIEDCLVDQSTLDYGSAIDILAGGGTETASGVIRNNTVQNWGGGSAVGAAGKDILIEGNTVSNCTAFFYADSDRIDHLVLRGNVITGSRSADLQFSPGFGTATFHDVIIEDNIDVLAGDGACFFGVTGIHGTAYNFTVRNNYVTQSSGSYYHPIWLDHIDNVSVYGNKFDGTKRAWSFGRDVTHLNFADEIEAPSFVGALKFTGTYSSGGYLLYAYSGTYTVVPGDHLQYEVFCDDTNGSFQPNGYLRFSDSMTTEAAADQWGIPLGTDPFISPPTVADVRGHANGKWYARDVDLTAYAGKTTSRFEFGDTSSVAGVNTHYWRNVRIVDKFGATKNYFYKQGYGAPTYLYSSNVSSYSAGPISVTEEYARADANNAAGTQSFADGARGTFDFSTIRTDSAGLLNTSTDRITSPSAGTMVVRWNCGLDTVTSAGSIRVEISKNGSPVAFSYIANPAKGVYPVVLTDACVAGDYYTCTLYNSTGSPVLVSQNNLETFVEAQFYPSLSL